MIGYLKGKILDLTPETVLLETGGVGYEVTISGSAFSQLSGKTEGELFTYLQVKEDGISLFGFSSKAEKNMFLQLITVSGVGPKMGIGVFSSMSVEQLVSTIARSDVKALSKVKGLGKKTAERIILELREKVSGLPAQQGTTLSTLPTATPVEEGDEDAVIALMTLGFKRDESERAVAKAKQQGAKTVEDIIMLALRSV
jgi:Holliday junction DNA helicase RuvA